LKFAGTIIEYGAPSEVTPTHDWTGDLPSHAGVALATVGAATSSDAASAAPATSVNERLNLKFLICYLVILSLAYPDA
jgi:hypothetical protein